MKTIETTRLIIRDFVMEDVEGLFEILGDAETMRYCEPAYDQEKTKSFLKTFCIGRRGAVAAVEKYNGKLLGYILLNELEPKVYEMGWIFHRSYWRQGYAFEACKAVIDHAFRELDAHKIFAETIDSEKSVPLMEKIGMTREGVQRGHTRDMNGNWVDLYLYGLLKE